MYSELSREELRVKRQALEKQLGIQLRVLLESNEQDLKILLDQLHTRVEQNDELLIQKLRQEHADYQRRK